VKCLKVVTILFLLSVTAAAESMNQSVVGIDDYLNNIVIGVNICSVQHCACAVRNSMCLFN